MLKQIFSAFMCWQFAMFSLVSTSAYANNVTTQRQNALMIEGSTQSGDVNQNLLNNAERLGSAYTEVKEGFHALNSDETLKRVAPAMALTALTTYIMLLDRKEAKEKDSRSTEAKLFGFLRGKDKARAACRAPSYSLMVWAAIALAATEIGTHLLYKDKLKKLEEKYSDLANVQESRNDYVVSQSTDWSRMSDQDRLTKGEEAQQQAFRYLADQQLAYKQAADWKARGYGVVSGLYSTAAVYALVEQAKNNNPQSGQVGMYNCNTASNTPENAAGEGEQSAGASGTGTDGIYNDVKPVESVDGSYSAYIEFNKFWDQFINIVSMSAHAKSDDKTGFLDARGFWGQGFVGLILVGLPVAGMLGLDVNKYLRKPYMRAALNGVLAANSITMMTYAINESKDANSRAESLNRLADAFKVSPHLTQCSEADRNDDLNPACFCTRLERITSDTGAQVVQQTLNPARRNHASCLNYNPQARPDLTATNYDTNSGDGNIRTCFSQSGQADPACKCRQTRSCLTFKGLAQLGGSIGATSFTGALASAAGGLFSGNLNSGNLNPYNIAGAGMRMQKAALDNLKKTPEGAKMAMAIDKMKNDLEKKSGQAARSIGGGMPSSAPSLANMNLPSQVKEKVQSQLDQVEAKIAKSGASTARSSASTKGGMDFDLGFDKGGDELSFEAMNKNYNYGDNDIHKGNHDNIFKILSLRYQQTGLRRLFPD